MKIQKINKNKKKIPKKFLAQSWNIFHPEQIKD